MGRKRKARNTHYNMKGRRKRTSLRSLVPEVTGVDRDHVAFESNCKAVNRIATLLGSVVHADVHRCLHPGNREAVVAFLREVHFNSDVKSALNWLSDPQRRASAEACDRLADALVHAMVRGGNLSEEERDRLERSIPPVPGAGTRAEDDPYIQLVNQVSDENAQEAHRDEVCELRRLQEQAWRKLRCRLLAQDLFPKLLGLGSERGKE